MTAKKAIAQEFHLELKSKLTSLDEKHNQTIVKQFSQQAIPFSELPGHSQSMQMLIELSGVSASDDVLDVACGPGLVACEFAQHARRVTGIDITPKMIEQAKERQKPGSHSGEARGRPASAAAVLQPRAH